MNTNIISAITNIDLRGGVVRMAAIAAIAAAAFIGFQSSTQTADAAMVINYPKANLCTFWSPTRTDSFSTTNPDLCRLSTLAPDYRRTDTGTIALLAPNVTPPANTVALYNWYNPTTRDNMIKRADLTGCPSVGVTTLNGYTCFRLEGFAFKTVQNNAGPCEYTTQMSTAFSTKLTDFSFKPSFQAVSGYANQYSGGHVITTFC